MKIKTLLTHPGTQYAHQLAKQLFYKKLLFKFYTGIIISNKSFFNKIINPLLPSNIRKKLSNRIIADIPTHYLKNFLHLEYQSIKAASHKNNTDVVFFKRNEIFQNKIPSNEITKCDVVIGFDTSSWLLIERTHSLNKKFILDVSIAHSATKKKMFQELAHQYPEWKVRLEEKNNNYILLEEKEQQTADKLVVASSFTKSTLIENGVSPDKIELIPYGVNLTQFPLKEYAVNKTLKLLFIGSVDARKGIPLLLDVMKEYDNKQVQLSIIGPIVPEVENIIKSYNLNNILIEGKIAHIDMPAIISKHDIFVFPSYFEGFGLVILEAMACGLPVITTTATAGPDIITNGVDGFIINVGDKQALQKNINFFIDNPLEIKTMGIAARKTAERYTWDVYGNKWASLINDLVHNEISIHTNPN